MTLGRVMLEEAGSAVLAFTAFPWRIGHRSGRTTLGASWSSYRPELPASFYCAPLEGICFTLALAAVEAGEIYDNVLLKRSRVGLDAKLQVSTLLNSDGRNTNRLVTQYLYVMLARVLG